MNSGPGVSDAASQYWEEELREEIRSPTSVRAILDILHKHCRGDASVILSGDGMTPLGLACQHRQKTLVSLFLNLDMGKRILFQEGKDEESPLLADTSFSVGLPKTQLGRDPVSPMTASSNSSESTCMDSSMVIFQKRWNEIGKTGKPKSDLDQMCHLIHCDVNKKDGRGRTALHLAAQQTCDIAELLVSAGADVNAHDSNDATPLHYSCIKGSVDLTLKLLESGASVNVKTVEKCTPLHYAAQRGFVDIVHLLLSHGAVLNAPDINDRTPLFLAASNACTGVMKTLISAGANVNLDDVRGYTPLCEAVWNHYADGVSHLLEAGADQLQSHCLLHSAVANNCTDIAQLLLKHGALVDGLNVSGQTPLYVACSQRAWNHSCIIAILLQHGANPNLCENLSSQLPLHALICVTVEPDRQHMFAEPAFLLFSHGADLDAKLLYHAALLKHWKAMHWLIQLGSDVNALLRGQDLMWLMRQYDNLPMGKLLIDAGYDVRHKSAWLEVLPCTIPHSYTPKSLKGLLVYCKTNPLQLVQLCRIVLRRVYGTRVHEIIRSSDLPLCVKKYMMLQDSDETWMFM
ncbi:unnamed protein product [Darwinula stevensoni]|uniref:Uncharacterized protein n=1 Tax=Darwinula stevensoni TaxID=69355 RepID=A0A7R8X7H4_9CRUS|nr:unnamed protein product [Darwinula stevensoni]CAG0880494.1 unnamed protein product [Darwinula stevensoni]